MIVRLPPPVKPECFTSQHEYEQWLVLARASGVLDMYPHAKAFATQVELGRAESEDYSAQLMRSLRRETDRALHYSRREPPYCMDCTPAYRDKMRAAGKCKYPDTRFRIAVDEDTGSFEVVGDRVSA